MEICFYLKRFKITNSEICNKDGDDAFHVVHECTKFYEDRENG